MEPSEAPRSASFPRCGLADREETFMHPDLVIGKQFPDLVFPDHRKQPVKLSELAKSFPLILSFYRGYW